MDEIELKELLVLFWNKKIKIFLIVIIFIIIGAVYTTQFVNPKYTSSTTIVLSTSEEQTNENNIQNETQKNNLTNTITTTDITLNSKLVSTYSELIKSKDVTRQVISNLKIDLDEEELLKNIQVNLEKDTQLIKISVSNADARDAYRIANEIVDVFSKKVSEIYNISNVYIVDKAKINYEPSNVNKVRDIVMFTGIGIIVAIIYVLLINMLDTTIKTSEDIEKQFKIPVLATIPKHNFNIEKGGKKKK